jgi:hypothetical protein
MKANTKAGRQARKHKDQHENTKINTKADEDEHTGPLGERPENQSTAKP